MSAGRPGAVAAAECQDAADARAELSAPPADQASDGGGVVAGQGHTGNAVVTAESAADSPADSAADWQRPPFQPGHELSTRHGAYSPRRVEPLAAELVAAVQAQPALAWLRQPEHAPGLWSWAKVAAQADLLHAGLLEHQATAHEGNVGETCQACEGLELRWLRADAAQAKRASRLGLDPVSRARIGVALRAMGEAGPARDLAREWAQTDDEGDR